LSFRRQYSTQLWLRILSSTCRASNTNQCFHKIAGWLKPAGLLLANFGIGNWEIDYEEDWLGVPMFWSSFDADGERAALASAGFELLIDRIETEIEDDRPHRWLVVLARTRPASRAK
jgi:hypothetical protein